MYSYFLERTQSARGTLAKALQLCPDEVCHYCCCCKHRSTAWVIVGDRQVIEPPSTETVPYRCWQLCLLSVEIQVKCHFWTLPISPPCGCTNDNHSHTLFDNFHSLEKISSTNLLSFPPVIDVVYIDCQASWVAGESCSQLILWCVWKVVSHYADSSHCVDEVMVVACVGRKLTITSYSWMTLVNQYPSRQPTHCQNEMCRYA